MNFCVAAVRVKGHGGEYPEQAAVLDAGGDCDHDGRGVAYPLWKRPNWE